MNELHYYEKEVGPMRLIANEQFKDIVARLIQYKERFEEEFEDEIDSGGHPEVQRLHDSLNYQFNEAILYYEFQIKEDDD